MVHEGLTLTSLAFILGIACLFFALLAFETALDSTQPRLRHAGLLTWLVSGNWPAKVGAGLVIIGVGALIRYFLLTVGISPELKMGAGVAASAVLSAVSFPLRDRADRRALHLALAGASLGVAYLTAYSAYGFFGYVTSTTALALLVLVTAATGVFAVRSNALSVVVLAMLGAFVSPAFTLGEPGPIVIYGYYLGASLFTFALVYLRGWRALIHLSFLFTLAGSVFFAWTSEFYDPQHFDVMQPLLLALVAVHLGMPLAERHAVHNAWLRRLDIGYAIALPAVAAMLMLLISPDLHTDGALGVLMLSGLWATTAGAIRVLRLEGALQHGLVAVILACAAAVLYVENVPWSLVGLVASTSLLIASPRLEFGKKAEMLLTGAVLLLAVFHIQDALLHPATGEAFLNQAFALRLFGVAVLITAGIDARRRDLPLGDVLSIVGWVWASLVMAIEIARLKLDILPQLVHAAVIAAVLVVAVSQIHRRLSVVWLGGLAVLSIVTAWWAAFDAPMQVTWGFVFLAPLALAVMAFRASLAGDINDPVAPVFALAIPLVLLPWALELNRVIAWHMPFFAMTIVVLSVLAVAYWGRASEWHASVWTSGSWLYFWTIALVMAGILLAHIARGPWPVAFDVACVATLAMLARAASDDRKNLAGGVTVAIAAFVLQAILLRWFGPPGILTVADLARMEWPAVVSFMWAMLGGAICWWSARIASRSLWAVGATLLALSAVKLVLYDFGSLGELANIVALLLAGVVFLAVAWLAPIPPRHEEESPEQVARRSRGQMKPRDETPAPEQGAGMQAGVTRPVGSNVSMRKYTLNRPAGSADDNTRSKRTLILVGALPLAVLAFIFSRPESAPRVPTPDVGAHDVLEEVPVAPQVAEPQTAAAVAVEPPAAESPVSSPLPLRVVDACTQFRERLPPDYVLLAGGAYGGRRLGFAIDQSGHEATGFDVVVNQSGRPVVLVLGAYEPSVWQVRRGAGTHIAGVLVTGYHRQAVTGVSAATPVLNSSYEEKGACGYSYLDRNNPDTMDRHVRQVFGRQAEAYYVATNGQILMGTGGMPGSSVQDAAGSFESFRDANTPLAGAAGLAELLAQGALRRARPSDLVEWKAAQRKAQGLQTVNIVGAAAEAPSSSPLLNAYVVQREMAYPAGLYGAHAVTFIVPQGVPAPTGNPGHSAVYNWNTLTCSGPLCGQGQ